MPTRQWFIESGCELTKPDELIFTAIYYSTGGKPCDGCHCKDTCPAWPLVQKKEVRQSPLLAALSHYNEIADKPRCPKCNSPLNMTKVARRGGKCACGEEVKA